MIRNQNSGGGGSMLRNADENPTLRGQLPPECQSNQVHGSNFLSKTIPKSGGQYASDYPRDIFPHSFKKGKGG